MHELDKNYDPKDENLAEVYRVACSKVGQPALNSEFAVGMLRIKSHNSKAKTISTQFFRNFCKIIFYV